jgi:integral membrane protein (TIGR01906 family)
MNSPTYAHKINSERRKQYKTLQILFSLALSLFIIFAAVKLTLMFKPLYYFDIKYLNIEDLSGFGKSEIIKNYDYVINYLLSPKVQEFNLPSIPYSNHGQIHFKDVKRIFTSIDILFVIAGLISVFGVVLNLKHKSFYFLKRTSSMLILLPTILLSAFMINFNTAFVIFHKIFFRNDYWQFDPELDPIINILPEEFFFHAALLIVILLILSIIVLRLLYKKLNKGNQV